jgi:hypothetical protein
MDQFLRTLHGRARMGKAMKPRKRLPARGRPVCVHCRKPYGSKGVKFETVRWDTPIKETVIRGPTGPSVHPFLDGDPLPPPPYEGTGIVIQERQAYLASDGRMSMIRRVWDGVTWYGGYKPFCTLRCALDYARKAYAKSENAR